MQQTFTPGAKVLVGPQQWPGTIQALQMMANGCAALINFEMRPGQIPRPTDWIDVRELKRAEEQK